MIVEKIIDKSPLKFNKDVDGVLSAVRNGRKIRLPFIRDRYFQILIENSEMPFIATHCIVQAMAYANSWANHFDKIGPNHATGFYVEDCYLHLLPDEEKSKPFFIGAATTHFIESSLDCECTSLNDYHFFRPQAGVVCCANFYPDDMIFFRKHVPCCGMSIA